MPTAGCMAPAMTGLSELEHWSCEGGAFWWHLGIGWGLQLAAQKAQREKKGIYGKKYDQILNQMNI